MKPWDGRDRDHVAPSQLTRRERQRLRALFEPPPHRRQSQPQLSSVFGLMLAVGVLAGLAWLLIPVDPVSPRLLH